MSDCSLFKSMRKSLLNVTVYRIYGRPIKSSSTSPRILRSTLSNTYVINRLVGHVNGTICILICWMVIHMFLSLAAGWNSSVFYFLEH